MTGLITRTNGGLKGKVSCNKNKDISVRYYVLLSILSISTVSYREFEREAEVIQFEFSCHLLHIVMQWTIWIHSEQLDVPFIQVVIHEFHGKQAVFVVVRLPNVSQFFHKPVRCSNRALRSCCLTRSRS